MTTTGSTPPRKNRSNVTGGEGGSLEEYAWRAAGEAAAAKKATRAWGVSVSLRSHFSSLVLLLLLLLVALAVSATTKNGDPAETPHAPPLPPPASIKLPSSSSSGGGECDLFSGRWVYDEAAYPLYRESACRVMSEQSACEKYGRTNLRYQHWRWQPHGCDLPRYVYVYYTLHTSYVYVRSVYIVVDLGVMNKNSLPVVHQLDHVDACW